MSIYDPEKAKNPSLSPEQKAFVTWAQRQRLSLRRNFYVPYHAAPYTYAELFEDITPENYYSETKTQGAWDGWRARGRANV